LDTLLEIAGIREELVKEGKWSMGEMDKIKII